MQRLDGSVALLALLAGCVHISDEEYAWRVAGGDTAAGGDGGADCVEHVWYTDADGDGYGDPTSPVEACEQPSGTAANYEDCDDGDPSVTTVRTWYIDADGDGWGGEGTTVACAAPTGYTATTGDCDDSSPSVHPGAVEDCSTEADDDCDGITNETDALGCTDWYVDADGDGFGGDDSTCACEAEGSYTTAEGGDCDDGDPEVNPGAAEVCYDGVDNDCDGSPGECAVEGGGSLGDATATLLGAAAGDLTGYAVAMVGDLDGDGVGDLLVGAPKSAVAASRAGTAWLLSGPISAGDHALADEAIAITGDAADDYLGWSATALGDVDGDGFDDFALGVPLYGEADAGVAALVHGPLTGDAAVSTAATLFSGDADGDRLGQSIASAGNAGGGAGLIVGAYLEDSGGSAAGAAYLVEGDAPAGSVGASATAMIVGEAAGDRLGFSVAGGKDLDGDGIDDLVVGADRSDYAAVNAGVAWIFLGPVSGTVSAGDADGALVGQTSYESLGYAVALADDLDGDGQADVVVGAPGYGSFAEAGSVLVLYGPADQVVADTSADAVIQGENAGDGFGSAVADAGDFDQDGKGDLIVGASSAGDGGGAWLVLGRIAGTLSASGDAWAFEPLAAGDAAGASVAGGGDLNGDGAPDLVVGATGADGSATGSGAAYMLLGGGL